MGVASGLADPCGHSHFGRVVGIAPDPSTDTFLNNKSVRLFRKFGYLDLPVGQRSRDSYVLPISSFFKTLLETPIFLKEDNWRLPEQTGSKNRYGCAD